MNKDKIVDQIIGTIGSERFAEWYAGRFCDYLDGSVDESVIRADVEKFFKLDGENKLG